MNCSKCHNPIDPRRLKALPNTTTCVGCSDVQRVGGIPLIRGKNDYSSVQIVSQSTAERVVKLMDRKGMSPSEGMKRGVN